MSTISPTHPAIKRYYDDMRDLAAQHATKETTVREAFKRLLAETARPLKWTLLAEETMRVAGGGGKAANIYLDGVLRDPYQIARGYYEAKDTGDNLEAEIEKKFAKGYPRRNILFENSQRAILVQGQERYAYTLADERHLADLLSRFYSYTEPQIETFERAVETFREKTGELAAALKTVLETAHAKNRAFGTAYAAFFALSQAAINPNISREAVDEMIIQHLLTERLMRNVLGNTEFTGRNVIAAELEKVVRALASQSFSRTEFFRPHDYFYKAIEDAAATLDDFSQKQAFIKFRTHYADDSITKEDIFYYTYAVLHHPGYRDQFAANLKKSLPRIPTLGDGAPGFWQLAQAGRRLADLHLNYETHAEYPLTRTYAPGKPFSPHVEKMKWQDDKKAIRVNDSLTLGGIPVAALDYKLGGRSALDWLIDQYQVKTDKRSGITHDPNLYSNDAPDGDQYIIQLIGRVTAVSLETVALVSKIAALPLNEASPA